MKNKEVSRKACPEPSRRGAKAQRDKARGLNPLSKGDNFAEGIRNAVTNLTSAGRDGLDFSLDDIVVAVRIQTRADRKKASDVLRYEVRRGRLERAGIGVYRKIGDKPEPVVRLAMWKVIRARVWITVADLMELAGASEAYAKQYLNMLVRRGIVKNFGGQGKIGKYKLINDPGPAPPGDTEKAAALRDLRRRKKDGVRKKLAEIAGLVSEITSEIGEI